MGKKPSRKGTDISEGCTSTSSKASVKVKLQPHLVLGGTVTKGKVMVGQTLLYGPDDESQFEEVQVCNIQR